MLCYYRLSSNLICRFLLDLRAELIHPNGQTADSGVLSTIRFAQFSSNVSGSVENPLDTDGMTEGALGEQKDDFFEENLVIGSGSRLSNASNYDAKASAVRCSS